MAIVRRLKPGSDICCGGLTVTIQEVKRDNVTVAVTAPESVAVNFLEGKLNPEDFVLVPKTLLREVRQHVSIQWPYVGKKLEPYLE